MTPSIDVLLLFQMPVHVELVHHNSFQPNKIPVSLPRRQKPAVKDEEIWQMPDSGHRSRPPPPLVPPPPEAPPPKRRRCGRKEERAGDSFPPVEDQRPGSFCRGEITTERNERRISSRLGKKNRLCSLAFASSRSSFCGMDFLSFLSLGF